jgi:hypothetical protein
MCGGCGAAMDCFTAAIVQVRWMIEQKLGTCRSVASVVKWR